MHYFRVPPQYWADRMKKLVSCGMNTLETYVAWNLHQPEPEGPFNFTGGLDLAAYIRTAQQLGLLVIVRPGPYICAEWYESLIASTSPQSGEGSVSCESAGRTGGFHGGSSRGSPPRHNCAARIRHTCRMWARTCECYSLLCSSSKSRPVAQGRGAGPDRTARVRERRADRGAAGGERVRELRAGPGVPGIPARALLGSGPRSDGAVRLERRGPLDAPGWRIEQPPAHDQLWRGSGCQRAGGSLAAGDAHRSAIRLRILDGLVRPLGRAAPHRPAPDRRAGYAGRARSQRQHQPLHGTPVSAFACCADALADLSIPRHTEAPTGAS